MLKGRSSAYPVQSLERKGTAKEAATEGAAWLPAAAAFFVSSAFFSKVGMSNGMPYWRHNRRIELEPHHDHATVNNDQIKTIQC